MCIRDSYNHLEGRVRIVAGDIKEAGTIFGPASFDVVVSNPPYMTGSHGLVNPNEAKAVARHEVLCTLPEQLPRIRGLPAHRARRAVRPAAQAVVRNRA